MHSNGKNHLQAPDGLRLHVRDWAPAGEPRATVVFLHGYDDHSGRYGETHERLAAAGFRVRSFDFRGHGQSGGARGFCREWREYLGDLESVLPGPAAAPEPVFLMGQSHGALVGSHALYPAEGPAEGSRLAGRITTPMNHASKMTILTSIDRRGSRVPKAKLALLSRIVAGTIMPTQRTSTSPIGGNGFVETVRCSSKSIARIAASISRDSPRLINRPTR